MRSGGHRRARAAHLPVGAGGTGALWNIPLRLWEFTGRVDVLERLDAALVISGRAVVQAVTGIGGVGKTSTAIEYAHRHADRFDIAWWIRAEDPALVPDRLAELAHALALAYPTDPTRVALQQLRATLHSSSRWVVVFDNAEDPRALAPLNPGSTSSSTRPGTTSTRPPRGSSQRGSSSVDVAKCATVPVNARR
jgi:hypothetical protein